MIAGAAALCVYVAFSRDRARRLAWLAAAVLPALIVLPALTDLYQAANAGDPLALARRRASPRRQRGGAQRGGRAGRRGGARAGSRGALPVAAAGREDRRSGRARGAGRGRARRVGRVRRHRGRPARLARPEGVGVSSRGGLAADRQGEPVHPQRSHRPGRAVADRAARLPAPPRCSGTAPAATATPTCGSAGGMLRRRSAMPTASSWRTSPSWGSWGWPCSRARSSAPAAGALRARRLGPAGAWVSAFALTAGAYWLVHSSLDWFWPYPASDRARCSPCSARPAPPRSGSIDRLRARGSRPPGRGRRRRSRWRRPPFPRSSASATSTTPTTPGRSDPARAYRRPRPGALAQPPERRAPARRGGDRPRERRSPASDRGLPRGDREAPRGVGLLLPAGGAAPAPRPGAGAPRAGRGAGARSPQRRGGGARRRTQLRRVHD